MMVVQRAMLAFCFLSSIAGMLCSIYKEWPLFVTILMAFFIGFFAQCILIDIVFGKIFDRH